MSLLSAVYTLQYLGITLHFALLCFQVARVALRHIHHLISKLLSTVYSWPPLISSAVSAISATEPNLNTSSLNIALKELVKSGKFIGKYSFMIQFGGRFGHSHTRGSDVSQ